MKNFLITLISIVVVLAAMYLFLNRDSMEVVKVVETKKVEVSKIRKEEIIPENKETPKEENEVALVNLNKKEYSGEKDQKVIPAVPIIKISDNEENEFKFSPDDYDDIEAVRKRDSQYENVSEHLLNDTPLNKRNTTVGWYRDAELVVLGNIKDGCIAGDQSGNFYVYESLKNNINVNIISIINLCHALIQDDKAMAAAFNKGLILFLDKNDRGYVLGHVEQSLYYLDNDGKVMSNRNYFSGLDENGQSILKNKKFKKVKYHTVEEFLSEINLHL